MAASSPFTEISLHLCEYCHSPGHAQYECARRFADVFGRPLPGFLSSGDRDPAAWSNGDLRVFGWLVFVLLLRVFHFHFLRFSSSWIFRFPLFTRPLFGGFHCFGYSSGQRFWLLPPGLGSAVSLPLVVEFLADSLLFHFGLLLPQACVLR